ncbi:MAG: hypothetical protein D6732_14850 [Methanobacteriota archaeon]|nr:MAG: hypothetical protein D6732_14850 [Euryarchaeota archaeon]
MPFTLYHWGFALLFGRRFEPDDRLRATIIGIVAVSFPDLEGFANVMLGMEQIPIHGVLHSFLGAFLSGLAIALLSKAIWKELSMEEFVLYTFLPLFGHVAIDLLMYPDMKPFLPFSGINNPIIIPFGQGLAFSLCIVALVVWAIWVIWDWLDEPGLV